MIFIQYVWFMYTGTLAKRSCAELWSEGVRIDMEYEIDPDGPEGVGPSFKVFCNLSEGKISIL